MVRKQLGLDEAIRHTLEDELKKFSNRTYLWVHLILDVAQDGIRCTKSHTLSDLVKTILQPTRTSLPAR